MAKDKTGEVNKGHFMEDWPQHIKVRCVHKHVGAAKSLHGMRGADRSMLHREDV